MGKYERGDIFIAEQIVDKLLNGVDVPEKLRRHKLFSHAEALAERIKRDFPNIRKSYHVGNIYGTSLGNIKLELLDGRSVFLEIKFLSGGTGTRANIGQDSLTKFGLFEGKNILSWKAFREKKSHEIWVEEKLDEFMNYPPSYKTIYEKASYLKSVLNTRGGESAERAANRVLSDQTLPGEKALAAKIVKEIVNRDHEEKLEYIEYLETLKQNHENIKKFLYLILAGVHTERHLRVMWNKPLSEILEVLGHEYCVYYIFKVSLRVTVEDLTKKLRNLMDNDTFISFRKADALISFKDERIGEVPILRIVFHWKNIFQGIKTPCLNVFDERYLRE